MPILTVVYVDDEPELCENFKDLFESETITIHTFTDPAQAIEFTHKHPPDLIFLDYRLPGTTGDDIASTMDPKISKCLITGDLNITNKLNSNFIKIFTKPYDISEIQITIDQLKAGK